MGTTLIRYDRAAQPYENKKNDLLVFALYNFGKDSEQTKQIEELQTQNEELVEEKERLLEEIERVLYI